MKITATCPSCDKALAVGEEHAGKKIRCPGCKNVVQLPPARKTAGAAAPTGGAGAGVKTRPARPAIPQRPAAGDRSRPAGRQQTAGKRRPRQTAVAAPDDIWNQPLSSYSSPAIPEEEYEAYGIEKKVRRRPNGVPYAEGEWEDEEQYQEEKYKPVLIFCLIFGVLGIVGCVLSFSVPQAGRIISFVALIPLALVSAFQSWRIIGNAYEESTMSGVLCWLFGPYFLFYTVSRWDDNKGPFLKSLLCSLATIAPAIGVAITDVGE